MRVTGTGPCGFPHQKQAGMDGCAKCSLDDAGANASAYGKSCYTRSRPDGCATKRPFRMDIPLVNKEPLYGHKENF